MCGISVFVSKSNEDILKELLASLYQLQNRGYDSAGIAYLGDSSQINIVKFASIGDCDSLESLKSEINKNNIKSQSAIGHTRWATHGPKTQINSHPHLSNNNKIILVHNGIIENFLELKNFLREKNYIFKSATDTEVIANLIEYYYCSDKDLSMENSIRLAGEKMHGTWALAIINTDELDTVYVTRNGSPLLIGFNENLLICTSEVSGFCNNVTNYRRLENHSILKIVNGIINEEPKHVEFLTIEHSDTSLTCDPYRYWTLKEIMEQDQSIMRALNNGGRICNNRVKLGGLYYLLPYLNTVDNIILLACGTSLHACEVAKYYFHENTNFKVSYYDASEFCEDFIAKDEKNIVIYCSQSGETRDLYKNIELCRKYNCINLGIVNVIDSLIANEVHCGVYMNAGREVAVASTKSFTSTLVILSLISILFAQNMENSPLINDTKHNNNIEDLRYLSEQVAILLHDLEFRNKCETIKNTVLSSLRLGQSNSIFILGKAKMFPIAKEAALKIKEMTYIHAEAYCGGSLKHGPFALLDENSVVFLFIDERNKTAMFNTYEEIKSRGAYCFIVSELDMELYINTDLVEKGVKTQILSIPKNHHYQEILAIVAMQYLTYIIAIEKGINPDRPRNLAKVVTVE